MGNTHSVRVHIGITINVKTTKVNPFICVVHKQTLIYAMVIDSLHLSPLYSYTGLRLLLGWLASGQKEPGIERARAQREREQNGWEEDLQNDWDLLALGVVFHHKLFTGWFQIRIDKESQSVETRPPKEWKNGNVYAQDERKSKLRKWTGVFVRGMGRKRKEECWPDAAFTLFSKGGLWMSVSKGCSLPLVSSGGRAPDSNTSEFIKLDNGLGLAPKIDQKKGARPLRGANQDRKIFRRSQGPRTRRHEGIRAIKTIREKKKYDGSRSEVKVFTTAAMTRFVVLPLMGPIVSLKPAASQVDSTAPTPAAAPYILPHSSTTDKELTRFGSGLWAIEAALQPPTARVTAVDLQPIPRNTSPFKKNPLTLSTREGFSSILEGILIDIFQIYHATDVLVRIIKLLKPGGWLVIDDQDLHFTGAGPATSLVFEKYIDIMQSRGVSFPLPTYEKTCLAMGVFGEFHAKEIPLCISEQSDDIKLNRLGEVYRVAFLPAVDTVTGKDTPGFTKELTQACRVEMNDLQRDTVFSFTFTRA
ncbi:hypothetical protein BU17DRAFT_65863 [Hysterangium stoloniferum]|nr:hypothetical protein BU17DRAFT_65863 [Hysterangium stoloniferum]